MSARFNVLRIILILILSSSLLTNCATSYVYNLGLMSAHMSEVKGVRQTDNGTLVFETVFKYEKKLHAGEYGNEYYERKRYAIITEQKINERLSGIAVQYDSTNRIKLNSSDCIIVPSDFFAPDAENSMLTEKYKSNLKFKNEDSAVICFSWPYNGQQINLRIMPDYCARDKRHWWGYPAQVLLVPALAVDLVGVPIMIVAFPFYFIGMCCGVFPPPT